MGFPVPLFLLYYLLYIHLTTIGMSVVIEVKGTPITFPSTGESPNWAPAIIEFAQATADALVGAVGPYDVPPTVNNIPAFNIGTGPFSIPELSFSISLVRSVVISYSIILNKAGGTSSEAGTIISYFDSNNNPQWTLSRDYVGETYSDFSITSSGEVQLTIPSGYGYIDGKISFSAKALEQV